VRGLFFCGLGFGDILAGGAFQFAADKVGREAGTEERSVDGCDFSLADFTTQRFEFAFDALAHHGGGIGFGCGGFQCRVDVRVGDTAGAEFAGNAELALLARLRAVAGELLCVACVVELAVFLEASHNHADQQVVARVARKLFQHFLDGVCAPHQSAESDLVEFLFGVELARAGTGEHEMKIAENGELRTETREPDAPKRRWSYSLEGLAPGRRLFRNLI